MALKTKLNTGDEGETNGLNHDGLKTMDDLDAVYINDLKTNGFDDSLLNQFMDITRELESMKKDKD